MSELSKAIQQAKVFWNDGYKIPFLYQLCDFYRLLAASETEELQGADIQTVADAIGLCDRFIALPEIADNISNKNAVTAMRTAFEDYLKGEADMQYLRQQAQVFSEWLDFWCLVGNFIYNYKLNNYRAHLSVELGEENTMDVYANVSPGHLDLKEALELRKKPLELGKEEHNPAFRVVNAATDLLLGGFFQSAIDAFEEVEKRLPELRAQCYNSMGAAYFFLDNYEKAIEFYLKALEAGESAQRIEYNVWEACQSLIKGLSNRNEQMRWVFLFKEHFPNSPRTLSI